MSSCLLHVRKELEHIGATSPCPRLAQAFCSHIYQWNMLVELSIVEVFLVSNAPLQVPIGSSRNHNWVVSWASVHDCLANSPMYSIASLEPIKAWTLMPISQQIWYPLAILIWVNTLYPRRTSQKRLVFVGMFMPFIFLDGWYWPRADSTCKIGPLHWRTNMLGTLRPVWKSPAMRQGRLPSTRASRVPGSCRHFRLNGTVKRYRRGDCLSNKGWAYCGGPDHNSLQPNGLTTLVTRDPC